MHEVIHVDVSLDGRILVTGVGVGLGISLVREPCTASYVVEISSYCLIHEGLHIFEDISLDQVHFS